MKNSINRDLIQYIGYLREYTGMKRKRALLTCNNSHLKLLLEIISGVTRVIIVINEDCENEIAMGDFGLYNTVKVKDLISLQSVISSNPDKKIHIQYGENRNVGILFEIFYNDHEQRVSLSIEFLLKELTDYFVHGYIEGD